MKRFKKIVQKLFVDQDGAALVEYGLLVALIAAVCMITIGLLGTSINNLFSAVQAKIGY